MIFDKQGQFSEKYKVYYDENMAKANLEITRFMDVCVIVLLIVLAGFFLGIMHGQMNIVVPTCMLGIVFFVMGSYHCKKTQGKVKGSHYILFAIIALVIFGINMISYYKLDLMVLLLILLSLRYGDCRFTLFQGIIAEAMLWLWAYCAAYLYPLTKIVNLNIIYFQEETVLLISGMAYDELREMMLPSSAMFNVALRVIIYPETVVLLVAIFMAIYVISNQIKMTQTLVDVSEKEKELSQQLTMAKTNVALSQIRPHFLYNIISCIMGIEGNPDETVDALGDFGKYLRENLSAIDGSNLILLDKEMEHVMRYISLEKLRFGDNVRVVYETDGSSFMLPPLSIQILVENAVKHGITRKRNGGLVKITTKKTDHYYTVTVEDDGVGFLTTPETTLMDQKGHYGMQNLRLRLKTFCGGKLDVVSHLGVGTKAVIYIPIKEMENGET